MELQTLASSPCGFMGRLQIFQWLTPEQSEQLSVEKKQQLEEEIADVMMYLVRLADKCNIDISDACQRKLAKNNEKYPVDKCYGSAKKYNEL
ncbi:MazG-like family protein [Photobacterium leiognathi subsp. mandapamensis]|uniref:MazG-like family protein n=1 Tax=Photobacterium leiognathi TaxID=553611 RepID=UPI003AF3D8F6